MNPIPIQIIEKIVSGELTDQERNEHLRQFDSENPENWRALALGFVEQQILRETFAESTSSRINPTSESISKPKSRSPWFMPTLSAAMLMIGLAVGMWLLPLPRNSEEGTISQAQPSPGDPPLEVSTSYVLAELENGNRLVLPIRHLKPSDL